MHNHEKTVLFCVLNWGLGHATRSIPIIRYLQDTNNWKVVIASDGGALTYLKCEFPHNDFIELPSYNVTYKISPVLGTFLSIPKILSAIVQEHLIVLDRVKVHKIDLIISDNRYGVFSARCPSYMVTHQLNPFFFVKPYLISVVFEWFTACIINRFHQVLIPDDRERQYTGRMSKNRFVKIPQRHIGVLNRFDAIKKKVKIDISILVILSGIEPSRSTFEKYIFSELRNYSGSIVVVLGRRLTENDRHSFPFDVRGIVDTHELYELLCSAKVIVSRSGYSSIMDYISLGLNAILIPTPDMPEQEYLANNIGKYAGFTVVLQKKDALCNAISDMKLGNADRTAGVDVNVFNVVF